MSVSSFSTQEYQDDPTNLSTVNLHGFEDEPYDDPFPGMLRGYTKRRKWIILGTIVAVVGLCGGLVGSLTGRSSSKEQSAPGENQPNLDGDSPSNDEPSPEDGDTQAPLSEIYTYIKSVAPDGGFAFDFFPESYQYRALKWLESDCAACDELQLRQRYALACIHIATNAVQSPYTDFELGVNREVLPWHDNTGWLVEDDECIWKGISCDAQGRVERIDLHDNFLTGKFPPETVMLKDSLKHLDLESNLVYNVDGEIDFLGHLTNLETLNVAQTPFEYHGIPPVIGKLTNLVHLDVSYTLFFGPLDDKIFKNLQQVEYLHIGGNSYNSSIPSTIAQMENLLYFYAEYADVEGDLSFIKNMPKIFELWVDKNPKMAGTIPSEIGDLITLESLSLTDSGLTGPIPTEMGNLYRMQQMWLFGNQLEGEVPASLGNLTRMNRCEMENNQLQGDMPDAICDLFDAGGRLEILEADCDSKITNCPCCTCCGPQCSFESFQSSSSSGQKPQKGDKDDNGRQRRLSFVTEQRRRRRLQLVGSQY